jgi:hypothetical protein
MSENGALAKEVKYWNLARRFISRSRAKWAAVSRIFHSLKISTFLFFFIPSYTAYIMPPASKIPEDAMPKALEAYHQSEKPNIADLARELQDLVRPYLWAYQPISQAC